MEVGQEEKLDDVLVGDRELWTDGPPHELFKRMRAECPVHWSAKITEYPEEDGFWSLSTADDIHEVSHDWQTYSSATGVTALTHAIMPVELVSAMFIGMDPPKHDRLKMLFQRGFTPKRIAEHESTIREITVNVMERLEGREECDLVTDVAQPVVSRVIHSFMGVPPEDDADWARLMNSIMGAGDPDVNPGGVESVMQKDVPELFERVHRLIEERRENPTDDLTSVLVHAEVEGERLEEHEIVMGFFLLVAAADGESRRAPEAGGRSLPDPERGRGVAAHVPGLRPFSPHRDARRRAERRDDPRGRQGGHVVRVVEP